jgi:hypothetical protein
MRHDDDLDDTDDELELEDDTDDFDDDGILKDSHSVRVPLRFMDSVQRAIHLDAANHRPGFRYADSDDTDTRDAAEESRNAYVKWLQGAHRTPVADTGAPERPSRKLTLDAARAEAERAYAEMCQFLRDAHRERRP